MRTASIVAAALVLSACGGDRPAAPELTAGPGVLYDDVLVAWTVPGSRPDRFELQARVGTGAWEVVDAAIPGDVEGGTLTLGPDLPELVDVGFRIRSIDGGERSRWSAEAVFRRGPRPAADLRAWVPPYEGGDVQLVWSRQSEVADGVAVDRGIVDQGSGDVSGVERIAVLGPDEVTLVDGSNAEQTPYRYSVVYLAGDRESLPVSVNATAANPLPPADLVAVGSGTGASLAWRNRSPSATGLSVRQSDGFALGGDAVIATLPPTAAEHAVAGPLSPGYHAWQVEVQNDYTWSRTVFRGLVIPPEGAALPLDATLRLAPPGAALARGPSGRLAVASNLSLAVEVADGWRSAVLEGVTQLLPPGLVFDGAGRPHAVTLEEAPPGLPNLVHRWFDGESWQAQVAATGVQVINVNGIWLATFTVTPAGAVHVLFLSDGPDLTTSLRDATDQGGAFAVEDAWTSQPGSSAGPVPPSASATDGQVVVAFLHGYAASLAFRTRDGAGAWTGLDVPLAPSDFVDQVALARPTPGEVAVALLGKRAGTPYLEVSTLAPAGLSATVPLAPAFRIGSMAGGSSRLVLACVEWSGPTPDLELREGSAAGWSTAVLGSGSPYVPVAAGVDGAGAVWALVLGGGGGREGTEYAVYAERP